MRPYIARVHHTIKSPVVREFVLGPKTLIVGHEGSGKTALLHAIRLAMTGKTSDVQGRGVEDEAVASPELLGTLGSPGTDITAVVTFSDGLKATWSREWGGASWGKAAQARPPYVDPMRCFPVDNARMALRGGKDAAVFFLGASGDIEAAKELVAGEAWNKLLDELVLPKGGSASSYLNAVEEQAKRKKLDLQAEARRLEALAEAPEPPYIAPGEVADPLAADLWNLVQLDKAVRDAEDAWTVAVGQVEVHQGTEPEPVAPEDAASVSFQSCVNDLYAGIVSVLTDAHEIDPELDACLLCGADHDPAHFQARRVGIEARLNRGLEAIQAAADRIKAVELWKAEHDRLVGEVAARNDAHTRAEATYGAAWEAVEMKHGIVLDNVAWPSKAPDANDEAVVRARAAHAEWRDAGDKAKLARIQAQNWGRLEDRATAALRTLARRRIDPFVARVNPHLLPGEELTVITTWGNTDVFIPALKRDGALPRPDLSGMERTRMLFALALANLPPAPNFVALIPDDRDRTFHTFVQWMDVLANVDAQVILTTAEIPDTLNVGPEWTVINLNDGQA